MLYHLKFFCFIFCVLPSFSFAQDIFDAARKGDIQRAQELVKINPDTLNKKNPAGFTPLVLSAYRGQIKFVAFLLEQQVKVNEDSPEGPALLGACYKGDLEITKLLLKHGADVNAKNSQGTTALIYATQANNIVLVKLLLESGANKTLAEKSGKTALSYAKQNSFTELIKLLE